MKADTQTIDILLLGSGGREHALAAKLAASPRAGKLYIAPGNGGTASCGENVVLDDCDPAAVAAFAQSHGCGLVVIGPEAPLVAGVADAVRAAGIPCFGPGAEGAQMEGSKLFSKQLMERAGIPTAAYGSFTDAASALAYVREQGAPLVVKAAGLAAGKGVIVATELSQAEEAVRECFGGTFGDAAENKTSRVCCQNLIKECIDVAAAAGIKIEPVQGKDILKLLDYKRNRIKKKISFALIPICIKKHGLLKASMLQDLEKGKKCEVDAINGVVCAYGRKYGVPTPYNDKVCEIIHGIEDGKYTYTFDNVKMFSNLPK